MLEETKLGLSQTPRLRPSVLDCPITPLPETEVPSLNENTAMTPALAREQSPPNTGIGHEQQHFLPSTNPYLCA